VGNQHREGQTYVLDGMSHTGHIILVAEASYIDVYGGTGLICLGIVNQEGLQVVWETDDPI
jgi:hypothetical protein